MWCQWTMTALVSVALHVENNRARYKTLQCLITLWHNMIFCINHDDSLSVLQNFWETSDKVSRVKSAHMGHFHVLQATDILQKIAHARNWVSHIKMLHATIFYPFLMNFLYHNNTLACKVFRWKMNSVLVGDCIVQIPGLIVGRIV